MSTITVKSEIAGKVWRILCRPGQLVMEVPVPARAGGEITALLVKQGDIIEEGQNLVILTT